MLPISDVHQHNNPIIENSFESEDVSKKNAKSSLESEIQKSKYIKQKRKKNESIKQHLEVFTRQDKQYSN